MPGPRCASLVLALAVAAAAAPAGAQVPGEPTVTTEAWRDARRGRTVPVRVVAPVAGPGEVPVIVYSHGLGGSREGGALWSGHWANGGYLVVHLQHPGSDESLWREGQGSPGERRDALVAAASGRQLLARVQDVKFALDEIARRKAQGDPVLARADLSRVGMAGHSFGAQATLAAAGQRWIRAGGLEPMLLEPRIKAAVALSPVYRARAGAPETQFSAIRIPFLSITGTLDGDVIGDGTRASDRTVPFEHMPAGDKYLAVFEGGDHSVFGGGLQRTPAAREREIQADVKSLTLAFWNAHLKGDPVARSWLDGAGVRAELAPGDRYETRP